MPTAGNEPSPPMTLDRAMTLALVDPLRRRGFGGGKNRLAILMYHRIADDPEASVRPYFRLATSPKRFASHMELLDRRGFRGVSLEFAMQVAERSPADLARLVAITFDDGYQDFHDAAWPVLRRHGFAATVYLPTAYIGTERRTFRGFPCLTWSEVRSLRREGVHFGSHTVNHPVLVREPWDRIQREVTESKATLERELEEEITAFAYPYAYPQSDRQYTGRFESLLRAAGYRTSVTTCIGRWSGADDWLALPRLPVNEADDDALLGAKLAGSYDWLGVPQRIVKRVKGWVKPARAQTLEARVGSSA